MAGVELQMTIDDKVVRDAIAALVAAAVDLKAPFEEIGASLVTSTQQRFEDEETPAGEAWPELAESTQARKVAKGTLRGKDHILRVQGDLYRSITYLATATQAEVGTNRVYAALQQLGGTADMPAGPAAVPARPFLGMSEADEQEITQILLDHLTEGIGG